MPTRGHRGVSGGASCARALTRRISRITRPTECAHRTSHGRSLPRVRVAHGDRAPLALFEQRYFGDIDPRSCGRPNRRRFAPRSPRTPSRPVRRARRGASHIALYGERRSARLGRASPWCDSFLNLVTASRRTRRTRGTSWRRCRRTTPIPSSRTCRRFTRRIPEGLEQSVASRGARSKPAPLLLSSMRSTSTRSGRC